MKKAAKKKAPDSAAIIAEAQRLMDSQFLTDAIALLEPLDGNPEADYRRAGLLLVLNRPAEAEILFRRLLTIVPDHLDTIVGLAGSLVGLGRPREALPLLKHAVQVLPNSGRIAYLAGVALEEAGLQPESEAQLAKARALVIAPAERRNLVPYEIYVQLSRRCNLHCTMCGWEIWKDNSGFMEEPVFERVIAEAKACGIKTMHILAGQGEPFLHPRIFECLERAVAEGFEVGIVTNGTPFTPQRIERLAKVGLAYLQFSFAGWDAESYESVYVGAKFDKAITTMKAIHKALSGTKTKFVVKAVALGDWQENLHKTKAFLATQGIHQVYTVQANNFGGSVQSGQLHERHGVWTLKDIDHHRLMPCRIFLKAVGVFCDGTVTACGCYDSNALLKIGNIMDQGLAEIRNGETYRRILDGFRKGCVKDVPMCGKCDDPFG
ncbi:radical SAM protein [Paramagnetospirillum kuznetsovii]|uniref:Radical SAM protein n=1 Tax=Paramagnetospirillum kuznetsovii TaxID=2053833 RepID=A0A364NVE8_9PROT|nr:radical SAM protein [Paramagnetospirillum kuznetsovii]RAU21058.1 radical SAM protein [Paramagnetospirillum kuznetsovii]